MRQIGSSLPIKCFKFYLIALHNHCIWNPFGPSFEQHCLSVTPEHRIVTVTVFNGPGWTFDLCSMQWQ